MAYYYPTLSKSSVFNQDVKSAQQILNAQALLLPMYVNGIFGNQTMIAVQQFQNLKGLEPTGVITPLTWVALLNPTLSKDAMQILLANQMAMAGSGGADVEGGPAGTLLSGIRGAKTQAQADAVALAEAATRAAIQAAEAAARAKTQADAIAAVKAQEIAKAAAAAAAAAKARAEVEAANAIVLAQKAAEYAAAQAKKNWMWAGAIGLGAVLVLFMRRR